MTKTAVIAGGLLGLISLDFAFCDSETEKAMLGHDRSGEIFNASRLEKKQDTKPVSLYGFGKVKIGKINNLQAASKPKAGPLQRFGVEIPAGVIGGAVAFSIPYMSLPATRGNGLFSLGYGGFFGAYGAGLHGWLKEITGPPASLAITAGSAGAVGFVLGALAAYIGCEGAPTRSQTLKAGFGWAGMTLIPTAAGIGVTELVRYIQNKRQAKQGQSAK